MVKKTANRNYEVLGTDMQLESCSPEVLYPTQYYVSPIYEETSMALREAECVTD